jgi:hypothetical protein
MFDPILRNFKFYRRKKGGKWYKVRKQDYSGWSTWIEFWTRDKDQGDIVTREDYERSF